MKEPIIIAKHQDTKEVISGTVYEVYKKLQGEISPEYYHIKLPDREIYGEQFLLEFASKYHEHIEN